MTIDVNIQLSHMIASDIGSMGDETTIIDTIYNDHGAVDRNNLASFVSEYFNISMDIGRINKTLKKLIKNKTIIESNGALSLSPATLEALLKTINANETTQTIAINQWVSDFEQLFETKITDPNELSCFKATILEFIRRFFLMQGVSSYSLIIGDRETGTSKVDEIVNEVISKCAKKNNDLLVQYLTCFFSRSTSDEQKSFLVQQFKKAIQYLSMVVTPETKNKLYEAFDGVVLYLDTSILYRAMNLQGTERYEAIKTLFHLCSKANIKLKVFQCTVDELKRRINYDAGVIEKHPTPVSFSSIGYKVRQEDNYISTFWKEQTETGISAGDFNFKYKNFLSQFALLGIEIDEDSKLSNPELMKKFDLLRPLVSKFGSSFDFDDRKSVSAIDHDTECMVLVEHLQRKNVATAIEAKYLFLSSDWSLMRLQRHEPEYKFKTDVVVLPSQMMQVLYLPTPSIEYYEAFIGIFASSRSLFGTNSLNNEQMQEIMGRVASYSQNPAFAEKILRNQLIQSMFSATEKEEERNKTIDDAIREELSQMEIDLKEKDSTILAKNKEIERKNTELKNQKEKYSIQAKNLETSNSQVELLKQQLDNAEEATQQTKQENEQLLKYKNIILETQEKKAKRMSLLLYFFGALPGFAGVLGILIIIAALIPDLSRLVTPLIEWVKTAEIVKVLGNVDVLSVIGTLSVGGIAASYALIRKGWKSIYSRCFQKRISKIDPTGDIISAEDNNNTI
ncbi:MAG: hypothetical protein QM308_02135 [Bacillota bacterium]|nr:hypothetical protein [Bacillota bacterium]